MKLKDNVAIVTGAGSGMGQAMAIRFASEGAKVLVLDINEEGAKSTTSKIKDSNGFAQFLRTDVSKPTEVRNAVEFAKSNLGKVDILVNNAGIPSFHRLIDTPEEEWNNVLGVNLTGGFLFMKHVIPDMIERKQGAILNVSSATGFTGKENRLAYGVSKAGLIFLTKAAALEYGRFGVRVNCICPGTIDTPFTRKAVQQSSQQQNLPISLGADHPIGRLGTVQEIAELALFLCSRDCEFLTGAIIPVDGGRTAGVYPN
jgi:NAD(P)-dependent dehydrogenase (short-subunit alcohol dehydrogenase family)